jgi:transcriptional regulator with XRE-family HTH domain
MTTQKRRPPRDDEEAAAFKGLGKAITTIRKRRGLGRDELASRCEITRVELEKLEGGSLDESWGGLRHIAKLLGVSLPALLNEAEKLTQAPDDDAPSHQGPKP